jgi:tetratricopeptide (TPR) repeat protein
MQIFFILLSLFWLVRFADTKERFSRPFLAASVFCFFLALLTKEASAFFAVIALLYGWGAAGRVKTPEGKRRFFRIAVFFSCAVILYFLLRVNALKCVFQPRYNIASCADVFTRYATSVKAFGEYLVILAAPVGLRFERTIPLASSPFEPQVLFGLLALAALGYAAFRLRGTKGAGFFGISWFLLNFIPVSNLLFPLNAFIAENWIQLPAIGVFLAVSSLAAGLFERFKGRALSRWLMVCLFIGIIIFYASLTVVRNFQYHDPIRWYLDAIRREPASVKLFNNMGVEYERRKDFDAAAEFYRKALELNPGHVTSLNNLANIYSANGRFDEAIELYKKALEAVPDNIFYMNNLGVAYIRKGDRESAVYWWKRSLGLNPDQPRIREYIEWNR